MTPIETWEFTSALSTYTGRAQAQRRRDRSARRRRMREAVLVMCQQLDSGHDCVQTTLVLRFSGQTGSGHWLGNHTILQEPWLVFGDRGDLDHIWSRM